MNKLQYHEGRGVQATLSLARTLSDNFEQPITLAVGKPGYSPSQGILRLPGLPMGELPRKTVKKLLAYIAHESWERRWSEWSALDPRWHHSDPEKRRPGLRALVNALNDARIDRLGSEEYPGVGLHLRELLIEQYSRMKARQPKPSVRNIAVLTRYVAEEIVTTNEVWKDFPAYRPWLDRITVFWDHLDIGTTEALIEDAIRMYEALTGKGILTDTEPLKNQGENLNEGREENPDWIPDQTGDEPDPDVETLNRIVSEFLPKQNLGDTARKYAEEEDLPHVYSFDPRDDKVYEPSIRNAEILPTDWYRRESQEMVVRLRQALTVNLPLPRRRQTVGRVDRRDIARLVTRHRDVFTRRVHQEAMSTAAMLGWDESNSMSGTRIQQVLQLAHIWNRALGGLRIPTGMYGWTTQGAPLRNWSVYRQEALRIRMYRDFSEPWDDPKVLKRLSMIDTQDGTPTGEALLFGVERLLQRPERRKVLFFMTDGEPDLAFHGRSEQVHHDFIRSVLQYARGAGVEVIGLGILADLSDFFERWVRIESADDILGKTTDELIHTLRRVS